MLEDVRRGVRGFVEAGVAAVSGALTPSRARDLAKSIASGQGVDQVNRVAQDLVEKVAKHARRPHHAQVTFSDDHGEAAVEIEVHVPRGKIHVAKAEAPDHRSALDAAIARMKRQLTDEKEASLPRKRTRRKGE